MEKKGKKKLQGVPQSQAAALPRHKEEEETDKTSVYRTNVRKALRLALSSPSEVITMLKGLKKHKNKRTQSCSPLVDDYALTLKFSFFNKSNPSHNQDENLVLVIHLTVIAKRFLPNQTFW